MAGIVGIFVFHVKQFGGELVKVLNIRAGIEGVCSLFYVKLFGGVLVKGLNLMAGIVGYFMFYVRQFGGALVKV